jgi:UDP-glucoronosyl and UDP-glucosyl transferase
MVSPQRILVLETVFGGGNWPPLAAVTLGLHQAGHVVQCVGDPAIAQDFATAAIPVEVVPAADTLRTRLAAWRAAGASGPSPVRAWGDDFLPAVCALVRDFRPQLILSELFTMQLAQRVKAACGLRWCYVHPGYYIGPDSRRPFEADYVSNRVITYADFVQAVGEADLVLYGTDPLFDPPPPSLPPHHHYVGPLMWERSSEAPTYLGVPGDPWVLVPLTTAGPQFQQEQIPLVRTALQTLAEFPVRVVVTLAEHLRDAIDPVPANAQIERFVPHSQVLTRCRLLVSPAGHGVVTKALYYGVPMVLIPWTGDQPGVAARAAALGVAEVVARHDITERRLAAAIQQVLGTPRYQENAARIAGHWQARDAVALARAQIEALLETP